MLIGRAPVRISFGGGGTDLQAYYGEYGGVVVSATIDKYIYGIVTRNGDKHFQMISADFQSLFNLPASERVSSITESRLGDLKLTASILEHFRLGAPFNVFLASEVPPGTGLGSSGAAAVNLINICSALTKRAMASQEIAELACHMEVDAQAAPVGKQDQYASAFGGINCIRFCKEGVRVEPLKLTRNTVRRLERCLMLFFTGNSRRAWEILKHQENSTRSGNEVVIGSLHRIKEIALQMKKSLETGDLSTFGCLLHESWQHKKVLAPTISNSTIDDAYLLARECGAEGGKIAGAGGGGFLMLYCEEEHQPKVRRALEARGMHEMRFAFEFHGASVLMNTVDYDRDPAWSKKP